MTTWMRPLLTLELWLPCDSCKPHYTATLHQPRHPHRALVCRLSRRSSRHCVVATVVTKGKRRRMKRLRWCRRCRSVPASTPTHTRHAWRRPPRRWVGVLELHPHLCRHPRVVRCPWLDPNVGSPLHAGRELAARHRPHPCTCVGAGHDVCLCLCVRVCLCLCGRACVHAVHASRHVMAHLWVVVAVVLVKSMLFQATHSVAYTCTERIQLCRQRRWQPTPPVVSQRLQDTPHLQRCHR